MYFLYYNLIAFASSFLITHYIHPVVSSCLLSNITLYKSYHTILSYKIDLLTFSLIGSLFGILLSFEIPDYFYHLIHLHLILCFVYSNTPPFCIKDTILFPQPHPLHHYLFSLFAFFYSFRVPKTKQYMYYVLFLLIINALP